MKDQKIILFTKKDLWCAQAVKLFCSIFGEKVQIFQGNVSDPFPNEFNNNNYDFIVSFLSPWIIPSWLLSNTKIAINFHPGSSNYPGIGCYNFALYEGASYYGAVCHHMFPKVDTGGIILEKVFKVLPQDTVESIKLRTMIIMLEMFHDVISTYATENSLNNFKNTISWKRKPFTRKELNDLTKISLDMSKDEIEKRLRALTYPGYPGLKIELAGVNFFSPVPNREPLA